MTNTFPNLTEKEHDLLSLSHDIRWAEGQIELFDELGDGQAVRYYEGLLKKYFERKNILENS